MGSLRNVSGSWTKDGGLCTFVAISERKERKEKEKDRSSSNRRFTIFAYSLSPQSVCSVFSHHLFVCKLRGRRMEATHRVNKIINKIIVKK